MDSIFSVSLDSKESSFFGYMYSNVSSLHIIRVNGFNLSKVLKDIQGVFFHWYKQVNLG